MFTTATHCPSTERAQPGFRVSSCKDIPYRMGNYINIFKYLCRRTSVSQLPVLLRLLSQTAALAPIRLG